MNTYLSPQQQRDIIKTLAVDVAAELDGFAAEVKDNDDCGVHLIGPGAQDLFVVLDWRDSERVEISAHYPRQSTPRQHENNIRVSRARGSTVIAKEIRRRLLPEYLTGLSTALDHLERDAHAEQARRDATEKLLNVGLHLGTHPSEHRPDVVIRRGEVWGHAKLNYGGTEVTLELHSVPVNAAIAMLNTLRREVKI